MKASTKTTSKATVFILLNSLPTATYEEGEKRAWYTCTKSGVEETMEANLVSDEPVCELSNLKQRLNIDIYGLNDVTVVRH